MTCVWRRPKKNEGARLSRSCAQLVKNTCTFSGFGGVQQFRWYHNHLKTRVLTRCYEAPVEVRERQALAPMICGQGCVGS